MNQYPVQLETGDLILRKAVPEDAKGLYYNVWSRGETARYMLWKPTESLEAAAIRMEKTMAWQRDHLAFNIVEKASGQPIGFVGFLEIEPDVYDDTGLALGPEFVGKGYGSQVLREMLRCCFQDLGAKEVQCSCRAANEASRRLILACGLKPWRTEEKEEYTIEVYRMNSAEYFGTPSPYEILKAD